MNTMTKFIFVTIALALATQAPPVFADSGEIDCHDPKNVKIKNAAKQRYEDMLAHDKAGRTKQAYDSANTIAADCISRDDREVKRIDAAIRGVLKKSSLKLGEQAESKGKFTEAYEYYLPFHGIAADRAQMKLATAKPGDFKAVRTGINYLRDTQKYLSEYLPKNTIDGRARLNARHGFSGDDIAWAMDPDRDARLKAIAGYLVKLQAIATKEGEKYLAEEDKIFNARKTSVTAQGNSLKEIEKAQDWLGLFGQEKRANDRAVKRGDTLLADDSRKSLDLAMSYYGLSRHDSDKNVRKVQDKARRLGDAHLKKGEKKLAADYYNLAGLGDKAFKLEEAHEAEKEKTETKRQQKFKQDQKSLEKELGF